MAIWRKKARYGGPAKKNSSEIVTRLRPPSGSFGYRRSSKKSNALEVGKSRAYPLMRKGLIGVKPILFWGKRFTWWWTAHLAAIIPKIQRWSILSITATLNPL